MIRDQIYKTACYLSWALNTDIKVQTIKPLFGGVHQNWLIVCQAKDKLCKFVIRSMPRIKKRNFARKIVPYNMEFEFNILKDLEKSILTTPRVWGLDKQGSFLGTPAFIMEYMEGKTITEAIKYDPDGILNSFTETILAMNSLSPVQLHHLENRNDLPNNHPADLLGWLKEQAQSIKVPSFFHLGLNILKEIPSNRPLPAFGNGDLNPQNFIHMNNGSIAIIDWEYAGFNDPIAELMLLHIYPEQLPFLSVYPVDKIYCQKAGLDINMLRWYEIYGALNAWIFAAKNGQREKMMHCEKWATTLTI